MAWRGFGLRLLRIGVAMVLGLFLYVSYVLYADPGSIRNLLSENLDVETRHSIIALYSLALNAAPETDDMVPIDHSGVNPYGVNVFLEQEVEEWKIRQTLQMIKDAGFQWIKQQLVWAEVEYPAKGQYIDRATGGESWEKYDRMVELAGEYGLKLIFRIDTSPAWARPDNAKLQTPPDDFEDYGDFVETVIQRYAGRVRYYQIWNEPNLAFEWGGQPPNPAEYVRLLEVAYRRAKLADTESVIISAAMAPTIEVSDRALSDLLFSEQMYSAGGGNWFDILGVNAYGLRHGPDDRRLTLERDMNFSRPILLRELMVRYNDSHKPMWAAEIGWNALPEDFPEEPMYGRVSRSLQASYTVRGYQRAQEEWPWMGVMTLWHFRRVHLEDKAQQFYYFNVVGEDFSPNPIYDAIRTLTSAPPTVYRGYHQETHWALSYSGDWQAGRIGEGDLGSYYRTDDADARLSFEFVGSDLDLVVPRGPDLGRLAISVDGLGPNSLPRVDGEAIADLYSPTEEQHVRVTVARGLPYGRYLVELRPASSAHPQSSERRVALAGIVVDGPTVQNRFWTVVFKAGLLSVGLAYFYSRKPWARRGVIGYYWNDEARHTSESTADSEDEVRDSVAGGGTR